MKSIGMILLTIFCLPSIAADLVSPFPSTIDAISIPNTHSISRLENVIRGMEPREKLIELFNYGVTDLLIIKNETPNQSVANTLRAVDELNQKHETTITATHIPLKWKNLDSFQETCEQVVGALEILNEVAASDSRTLFFHCTVGEDRTGVVAGLFRMLEQGWTVNQAFRDEMCEWGYEASNPNKAKDSPAVVKSIRDELTPFFLKMAYLIQEGELTGTSLDRKVCSHPHFNSKSFRNSDFSKPWLFRCRPKKLG